MTPRPFEFPDRGIGDGEITLRLWREADMSAVVEALQDPEIPRWTLIPEHYTEADARERFAIQERERRQGTGLQLLVVDAGDDRLLGSVGLLDVEWEQRRTDISYWVARESRGRRVAPRAVRLLARWVFDTLPFRRIGLLIDPENPASLRVAERAGFTPEGVLRSVIIIKGERRDMASFSLLPDELGDEPLAPRAVR